MKCDMPSVDAARRRLRLSDAHISVLGLLVEEAQIPDELAQARAELRGAGVLDASDKISAELSAVGGLVGLLRDHRLDVASAQVGTVGAGGVSLMGPEGRYASSDHGWGFRPSGRGASL